MMHTLKSTIGARLKMDAIAIQSTYYFVYYNESTSIYPFSMNFPGGLFKVT